MSFTNILNVSVSASWLVIAIALLRLVLKRTPKALHCALWALVAVRLLCPAALPQSGMSLVPTAQVVPEQYLTMEPRENLSQPAKLELVTNPNYPEPVAIELETTVDRVQRLDLNWTLVWWLGMGAMAVYGLYSYLSLRLRVRLSVALEKNILLCDEIDSPFVLGLLRPRICLPSAMPTEQMRCVIAHEKAHIRRLDHWWKLLGFGLLTVHWFNPVMWLGYGLLCRDIELACDEAVIRHMDKAAVRQYSEALIACGTRDRFAAACPLAFGEVGVKERVKSMVSYKKPGFWIILAALVLCVALIACFMTEPLTYTTLGSLEDEWVGAVLEDVDVLTFVSGDLRIMEMENAQDMAEELSNLAVSVSPVSKSRSEDRDSTWKIVVDNGTALCISEDFSEIWLNNGVKPGYSYRLKEPDALKRIFSGYHPSAAQDQTRLSGTYVPYQCMYMNPLSSFYPFGGDSGCLYHFGEDSFTIDSRNGAATVFDPVNWDWKAVDWDSEIFSGLTGNDILLQSASLRPMIGEDGVYQLLDWDLMLVYGDSGLLLVRTYDVPKIGRALWSVYRLVPQQQMGMAQWDFQPQYSHQVPGFRFEPDMEYTYITAFAEGGILISFDESSPAGYPEGTWMELEAGKALYWCPVEEDGSVSSGARIHITIQNGEQTVAQGSIYITGEKTELSRWLYTARIVGTGLRLEQNEEQPGGIIVFGSK